MGDGGVAKRNPVQWEVTEPFATGIYELSRFTCE